MWIGEHGVNYRADGIKEMIKDIKDSVEEALSIFNRRFDVLVHESESLGCTNIEVTIRFYKKGKEFGYRNLVRPYSVGECRDDAIKELSHNAQEQMFKIISMRGEENERFK